MVTELQFLSNEIEFFGLRFAVSQDKIILFCTIAVGYLLCIFVLRVSQYAWVLSPQDQRHFEELNDAIQATISARERERNRSFNQIVSPLSNNGDDEEPHSMAEIERVTDELRELSKKEGEISYDFVRWVEKSRLKTTWIARRNYFLLEVIPPFLSAVLSIAISMGWISIF